MRKEYRAKSACAAVQGGLIRRSRPDGLRLTPPVAHRLQSQAALSVISMRQPGYASAATWTQARHGALPSGSHSSHSAFIAA